MFLSLYGQTTNNHLTLRRGNNELDEFTNFWCVLYEFLGVLYEFLVCVINSLIR